MTLSGGMLLLATTLTHAADPRDLIAPLGTDQIASVHTIAFTFVTERSGVERSRRQWTWTPSTRAVVRTIGDQSLAFTAGAPRDDAERKADAQFVNDSFWLMPHLHARWAGADLAVTDAGMAPLPIGAGTARQVVLQYASDAGGYTPGDRYDLYLDATGRIVAWTYTGKDDPTDPLTTTFEAYVDIGPLSIATDHRTADGSFRVRFTDLAVR